MSVKYKVRVGIADFGAAEDILKLVQIAFAVGVFFVQQFPDILFVGLINLMEFKECQGVVCEPEIVSGGRRHIHQVQFKHIISAGEAGDDFGVFYMKLDIFVKAFLIRVPYILKAV